MAVSGSKACGRQFSRRCIRGVLRNRWGRCPENAKGKEMKQVENGRYDY
jgi:hypothetical protein